jgi:PDZ domain
MLLAAALASSQTSAQTPATVPVTLDHNHIIIDVYFPMPDGSKTRARAWVDPGDTKLSITQALSKKLGLAVSGSQSDHRVSQLPEEMLLGGMPLSLRGIKEATAMSEASIAPGSSASIKLPATALRNYDVEINYPDREFTIANAGKLHFDGTAVKVAIGELTGLVQMQCDVAGEKHTIAFDPGTTVSWISGELISKWHKEHPDWPAMLGAVGPANLWGLPGEPTWHVLRIPKIQCAGVQFSNGIAVPFDKETIEWYQKRAAVATIGLIGADVVLNYRVGIDYAHSTVYLRAESKYTPPGIDVVGLTLRPEEDETYTVIGVSARDGKPAVAEVKVGDTLLTVDGARVTGATMGQVWSLLSGSPGDVRTLGLTREGKLITVKATVYRYLPSVKVEPTAKNHSQ